MKLGSSLEYELAITEPRAKLQYIVCMSDKRDMLMSYCHARIARNGEQVTFSAV
jgi:hypothetical protein